LKLIREHFETIEGYDPAPYSGSAQLFRSTRQPVLGTQSPTLGWEHIIRGGLSVTEIVGTHAVLLGRPQAKELAQAIGAVLAHKSESTDRS
jgi:thioesterase domain-containing protein